LARAQRSNRAERLFRFDNRLRSAAPYTDAEFDRVLSSMMLHHVGQDAKPLRRGNLPRPSSRRQAALVDIGGEAAAPTA